MRALDYYDTQPRQELDHSYCAQSQMASGQCPVANFSAAFVVAHAPPEVANELVRKQWWEELSQNVLGMAPRSGQVWLLMDANGRLGSHTSAAVGSCHAQTQNGNGKALHSLMLEAGLYATNTFTQEGKATCVWIAKRRRLCAASSEECCQQGGDL